MNFISDKSYLAIGKQTAAGVPVIPGVFVPFIDADIKTDTKNTRVKQIAGIDWKSNKVLQGNREHSGTITIQCDPDNLEYFLSNFGSKGSTTGNGTIGYTHPHDVIADGKYYTMEILKGNAVTRLTDVKVTKMEFTLQDSYLQVVLTVMAQAAFTTATLKTALSGAVTSLVANTLYSLTPFEGAVVGDTINISVAGVITPVIILTISSDQTTITFTSASITAAAGSLLTLAPQTPSYATLQRPFRLGRALVGFGATMAAAQTAVGSLATATPLEDIKLMLDKGAQLVFASGNEDATVLSGTPDASFTIKKLFTDMAEGQAYLDIAKQCCSIVFTGDEITSGYRSSLTINLYDIKVAKHDNKIKNESYIYDETDFTVEYSNADAKSMDVILCNATAGTAF